MAYFIKLITPPNGIVLDPFGGSGTTAVSAIETGFNYVLIEKAEEYLNIINQRISATKSKIEQLALTTN
jgi:site-specific DNA-methyltransferase (adenine-specific)